MKDLTVRSTGDLLEKRPRGRPRKDHALSDAERARRYRQRRLLNAGARPVLLTAEDRAVLRRLIRDDQAAAGLGSAADREWNRMTSAVLGKLQD